MNNKINSIYLLVIVAVLSICGGLLYVQNKSKAIDKMYNDQDYEAYILAYTSGNISTESSIKIQFISEIISQDSVNQSVTENIFKFSPSIQGKAKWISRNTILFTPTENLPSNTKYTCTFEIDKIIQMPEKLKTFSFNFSTLMQNYEVEVFGLYYPESKLDSMVLKGQILTLDPAKDVDVEKMIQCNNSIKWVHESERKHIWEITGIKRENEYKKYKIKFTGDQIESITNVEKYYTIPPLHVFEVAETKVFQGEEQYVKITFTEPLDRLQDFSGIITLGSMPQLRTVVESNVVYVYAPLKQKGNLQLTINEGVKNVAGKKISKVYTNNLSFDEQKPAIKLVGNGMIVPSSNNFKFPFEAINIKAVEVIIFKIHEQNIIQFFQVNSYGDKYDPNELRRVGKRIMHKIVPINNYNESDYGIWKRYELDLAELVRNEPSAIYQVIVSFKKEHTTIACDGKPNFTPVLEQNLSSVQEINNFNSQFATYDYYDGYYPEDYNYEERENPCSSSYYISSNTTRKKLIYHSDIGLIAKKNAEGNGVIIATDLIDAKPIKNIDIFLYDYQNILLEKGKTDEDGMYKISNNYRVFMAIAKTENQSSYLKLDDIAAQNTTYFDVSGNEITKGIKSFIYGERGVWRPGDSLHLTFILEDKLNKIPKNYPITLDLSNPQGQIVHHEVNTKETNRMYTFHIKTEPTAPTGHWQAAFKVGGARFYKDIRIETILPNRLKINVDFEDEKIISNANNCKGKINVMWLHGAIGTNLQTTIDASYSPSETVFIGFEKYDFNDITTNFYAETQQILDTKTNELGENNFNFQINKELQFSGLMNIDFKVKSYENGGTASSYIASIPFSPYKSYIGLAVPKSKNKSAFVYETNSNQKIEIANVTEDGTPIKSNTIEINVYKLDWHWWYDNSDKNLYMDFNSATPTHTINTKIIQGKGNFNLKIDNENWGRYLVRIKDSNGHTCSKILYFDWPGYGASANSVGASVIAISTDKKVYSVGEKIKVSLPSSDIGKALISIESGSKILKTIWIDTKKGFTEHEFDALPEYTPNIYLHITLLQPYNQTSNDLPIRMYGIAAIEVQNKDNIITPVIETQVEFKPLENCTISINEKSGKPMTYSLAVVDEGLLDITRFITPNPYASFYAKESLGVTTWDLYDYVMGSTAGQVARNLSIGGDEGLKKGNDTPLNRFMPVVKFLGPYYVSENSKNKHSFKMPNYVGSVKIMVVAAQNNTYGNAEKSVLVRKPFMLLATLPRVCGPDEEIDLPVNIFSMDKKIQNITISLQTNGVIQTVESNSQTINLKGETNCLAWFKLKVKPTTGQGRVIITAKSGGETAIYDVLIESRNANVEQTNIIEKTLEPNENFSQNITPFGMAGSNKIALEVSNMPAINLESRLKYLMQYPYGCVEQTTSSVFPQLFLDKFIELDKNQKLKIEKNIKAGIVRLTRFQNLDGGLGYWQGDSYSNEWGTIYALHFLILAEKNGYMIGNVFKENCIKYLQKNVQIWQPKNKNNSYNQDAVQAYRLYVLALSGNEDQAAMNRLKEYPKLTPQATARLASAFALIGQIKSTNNLLLKTKNITQFSVTDQYNNDNFGSETRDNAIMLEIFAEMKDKIKSIELSKIVATKLASSSYMNTQEIAFSLLAMSKMVDLFGKKDDLSFNYIIGNTKTVQAKTRLPIAQIKFNCESKSNLFLKNTSKSLQYVRIIQNGIPTNGQEKSYENNINLSISYNNKDGNPIDITTLKQGTIFFANITIKHPGILPAYKNLALKQIFPSGWEISNSRFEALNGIKSNAKLFDYQDIKDDRMYTFFGLGSKETKNFTVQLTASYIGKYYLPTQTLESMYMGQINAATKGKWVRVIKGSAVN